MVANANEDTQACTMVVKVALPRYMELLRREVLLKHLIAHRFEQKQRHDSLSFPPPIPEALGAGAHNPGPPLVKLGQGEFVQNYDPKPWRIRQWVRSVLGVTT